MLLECIRNDNSRYWRPRNLPYGRKSKRSFFSKIGKVTVGKKKNPLDAKHWYRFKNVFDDEGAKYLGLSGIAWMAHWARTSKEDKSLQDKMAKIDVLEMFWKSKKLQCADENDKVTETQVGIQKSL